MSLTTKINGLTVRQQQVLDFIVEHHAAFKICPTTREIQQRFSFASQTAAMSHVNALLRKRCPLISKTASGRLVYHDLRERIPWEDVKPLIDELKEWQAMAEAGPDEATECALETFFEKYPHLKNDH